MEKWKKYFKRDKFCAACGIELKEVKPGYAKAEMVVTPEHYNSVEIVQGGAIFTLADFAFAAASNSYGTVALGINCSISYCKAVTEGKLIAEAHEISSSRRMGNYRVDVKDDKGDIVALFQSQVYKKKDQIII